VAEATASPRLTLRVSLPSAPSSTDGAPRLQQTGSVKSLQPWQVLPSCPSEGAEPALKPEPRPAMTNVAACRLPLASKELQAQILTLAAGRLTPRATRDVCRHWRPSSGTRTHEPGPATASSHQTLPTCRARPSAAERCTVRQSLPGVLLPLCL
jgi:hypothetical protein